MSARRRVPPFRVVREVVRHAIADDLADVAAQLAYGSLLAVFPFLIFLVTILGVLPIRGLEREIMGLLHAVMPREAASLFDTTVKHVVQVRNLKLLSVSLLGTLWAASGGVASLTSALNRAYDVGETRSWLRVRVQSLAITIVGTLLLIVAFATLMVGPRWAQAITGYVGLADEFAIVWRVARWPATVVAMTTLLGMTYWACPNVKQRFRLITPGAIFAVPAWIVVSLGFGLYVKNLGSFNKTYGALGAGVVLLVWIYLSGLIVLLGGEINAAVERIATGQRLQRRR